MNPPDNSPASVPSLESGQVLANLLDRFIALTEVHHLTHRAAAAQLGKSPSFFSGAHSALARYRRGGLAALAPAPSGGTANASDLTLRLEALGWFIPAAQFLYSNTNYNFERGSVPEAVRCAMSLPHLPNGWRTDTRTRFLRTIAPHLSPVQSSKFEVQGSKFVLPTFPADLRLEILARERANQPLVPERIARQIIVNPSIVRRLRSPKAWSLDNLCAPGSQRRYYNAAAGQRQIMQPGDWFGGDDATPGIGVIVPCNEVITPCSQRYGVLLGRFQWLAYNDCRADKLLAWDYVVRPRGSYRAEDVVNGMGMVTRAHGIPRIGWQLEGGTFNSLLVRNCIKLLDVQHWRTYSPHQKAIESIFNRVWTRLAVQFPHADMGRYRNENEANCRLYELCKAGGRDPHKYFPTLEMVVAVFEEEVRTHNARYIDSIQYGRWVPDELFDQSVTANPLKKFRPEMDFMFSPYAVERRIHGMMVRCRVPMFENFSVPFEFHADWMPLHDHRLVRLYFNPRAPNAIATIELREASAGRKAGDILGSAKLIGETAGHIRMIMGWAEDDQRAGYIARQRTANFMRRETRAIVGKTVLRTSEERDGLGQVTKVESGQVSPAIGDAAIGDAATGAGPLAIGDGRLAIETTTDLPSRLERAEQWEKQNALDFIP